MTDGAPIPIRVGVAEMLPVVAEGLRAWLVADPRLVMVEAAVPPSDADVLVLDPGRPRDGALTDIAALASAGARVVAFSQPTSRDVVRAILEAGAQAFVPLSQDRRRLIGAIVAVARHRPVEAVTGSRSAGGAPRWHVPQLSEQEHTALRWWLRSMTKASVARRMGISPHTVDMYIRRIRAKYAQVGRPVPTKADLLLRAIEDGLFAP
ncbi:LuxR C-terminal-related transcriptional regulator [Nonomuraea guangzhouensis]|uniref:LuxR C-terminal-related transcriptional regulator n=1 Tax=Nonomuraea guangzhouensis TaxID=1291555 RepID=A0ABW4G699_9ACTN|nr:LuxR C-terminal-related transcriptional regulator [Nonomuraea guangzhouensis]